MKEALFFVYEGNSPGERGENTCCSSYGSELVSRFGFSIRSNQLKKEPVPRAINPLKGSGIIRHDFPEPLPGSTTKKCVLRSFSSFEMQYNGNSNRYSL